MKPQDRAEFHVKKGVCYALYAFDIGIEIDLDRCRKLITSGNMDSGLRTNRRAPKFFDYHPAPLRVTEETAPLAVGDLRTSGTVDIVVYDFGGVSVTYAVPFEGGWDRLRTLSDTLCDSDRLKLEARKRVTDLLSSIRAAVSRPSLAEFTEDYLIFQIEELSSDRPVRDLPKRYAHEMAQVLRAEVESLSEDEVSDALTCKIAFGPDDLTLVDWNAALTFDRDADDVRAVLEFANVELLELRFLDFQLDASLDRSYQRVVHRTALEMFGLARSSGLKMVGQLQVESAILFERVSNAIKLLGDQYLARVYRLASQRFHLAEWNAGILRKLEAIDNVYEKINDRNANRRLEILEWIIILLIAFEIVWPFVSKYVLK